MEQAALVISLISMCGGLLGSLMAFAKATTRSEEQLKQLTARYENTKNELSNLIKEKEGLLVKVTKRDEEMIRVHEFITDAKSNASKHDTVYSELAEVKSDVKHLTQELSDIKLALNRIEANQRNG